jgi:hypothetical protein
MDKIDRLGWAAGFAFESYGVRAGIRGSSADVVSLAAERLPRGWKLINVERVDKLYSVIVGDRETSGGIRWLSLLFDDIVRVVRTRRAEEVFNALESRVRLHIAEMSPRRVFVHAGAVGWRGRGIIVPGRTLTGKSTLVAELVKAGADYYSDEFAVLDSRGRLHPFHKPLALRTAVAGRQENRTVEELGGTNGMRALPVGLIAVTRYVEGARWRPAQLSPARGVLELFDNSVAARRRPEQVLSALEQAASNALVLKGTRGAAKETAEALLELANK